MDIKLALAGIQNRPAIDPRHPWEEMKGFISILSAITPEDHFGPDCTGHQGVGQKCLKV